MMFKCKYKKSFDFNLFMINSKFHSDIVDLLRLRSFNDYIGMRDKLTASDARRLEYLFNDGESIDVLFSFCVECLHEYYLATRYGRKE